MKKIIYSFLTIGAILFAASCAEVAPYEPAPVPTGDQVYFDNTLPAIYDISAVEEDVHTIVIPISRVNSSDILNIPFSNTCEGQTEGVTIPVNVNFAQGSNTADIEIVVDKTKYAEDARSVITLKITREEHITPYGADSYTFTITNPKPTSWKVFDTGVMTEGGWGETEKGKTLYYMEIDATHRLCKVPECFGFETRAAGGEYDVQDYVFMWDTETDEICVPPFYMGFTDEGEDFLVSDAAGFYALYQGLAEPAYTVEYFDWAVSFLKRNGFTVPHYDGNGGFYLGDWMYALPSTMGYSFGDLQDTFICDSFVRTTDYNTDITWAPIALGKLTSEAFKLEDVDIKVCVGEDPDYDETAPSNLYYIQNYFEEGSGLAFKVVASDATEEAVYSIEDCANIQHTGSIVFGREIGASIVGRKSVISGPIDGTHFPVDIDLCVKLSLYDISIGERGETVYTKAVDLGEFMEKVTLTDPAWYAASQLSGLSKEYYVSPYVINGVDCADMSAMQWEGEIEDAGSDEDGVEWLAIHNIIPLPTSYVADNTIYAEWYEGMIYLANGTPFESDFSYGGESYPLYALVYDSNADEISNDEYDYLLGGYFITEDESYESVPFVNYPYNEGVANADGLAFLAEDFDYVGFIKEFEFLFADEAGTSAKAVKSSVASRSSLVPAKWQVKTLAKAKALRNMSQAIHKTFNLPSTKVPYARTESSLRSFKHKGTLNTSKMKEAGSARKTLRKFEGK